MTKLTKRPYSAGIYEQSDDGWSRVEWSRHSSAKLAAASARGYLRSRAAPTGGALTWSAWWMGPDEVEHRLDPRSVEATTGDVAP